MERNPKRGYNMGKVSRGRDLGLLKGGNLYLTNLANKEETW